jgi:hypothetical protein
LHERLHVVKEIREEQARKPYIDAVSKIQTVLAQAEEANLRSRSKVMWDLYVKIRDIVPRRVKFPGIEQGYLCISSEQDKTGVWLGVDGFRIGSTSYGEIGKCILLDDKTMDTKTVYEQFKNRYGSHTKPSRLYEVADEMQQIVTNFGDVEQGFYTTVASILGTDDLPINNPLLSVDAWANAVKRYADAEMKKAEPAVEITSEKSNLYNTFTDVINTEYVKRMHDIMHITKEIKDLELYDELQSLAVSNGFSDRLLRNDVWITDEKFKDNDIKCNYCFSSNLFTIKISNKDKVIDIMFYYNSIDIESFLKKELCSIWTASEKEEITLANMKDANCINMLTDAIRKIPELFNVYESQFYKCVNTILDMCEKQEE